MRFLSRASAVALLASNVLGHPAAAPPSDGAGAVEKGAANLRQFRFSTESTYTRVESSGDSGLKSVTKRATYVDTAAAAVQAKYPKASFRLLDGNYVGNNGIGHAHFKQTYNNLDIENADFGVHIGRDGTLFSYSESFYPLEKPIFRYGTVEPIEPLQALRAVIKKHDFGIGLERASAVSNEPSGVRSFTIEGTSGTKSAPKASLVYLKRKNKKGVVELELSWKLEIHTNLNWLLIYIDASYGVELIGITDYISHATYNVFPWGTTDPSKGSRAIEVDPEATSASKSGWIGNKNVATTKANGNNAICVTNWWDEEDLTEGFSPDGGKSLNFDFPLDITQSDPSSYIAASSTQLFYTVNFYHDLLYLLGFNELAGNFQNDNGDRGGLGNDAVTLHPQDANGMNGAVFATPPDGQRPYMRLFLWNKTSPHRDPSFDTSIVIHEYTHGLTQRLTGGPSNPGCLAAPEASSLGEGWSDFMATALQVKKGDTRNKDYVIGSWVSGDEKGLREFPYSTNIENNYFFYAHANGLQDKHEIGAIWASMLYDVLWSFVDRYGMRDERLPEFDFDGVPLDGRFLAMKLVVDALALQPCNPSFISARDSILYADEILTGAKNKCLLWAAFAQRGLGVTAQKFEDWHVNSWGLPNECRQEYLMGLQGTH
ncbi:extracellular elastinolytic metalloproteinase precursor [Marssonina coronariae]|uniref:Extracellular metalloproteinase n=1 Tax=Diplocarpon coronariae TaxID=2795749 RepID=A0A218Z385_9HELO|nr:extracellular elastinolytic metalloproteinase precursor [Marssonina coronariae]